MSVPYQRARFKLPPCTSELSEALKMLIEHPDPVMREHAARVLGAIGVKNFYQPVLGLMNDPDARVRRAAINAAGVLRSPEFVIPLIYRTQDIETRVQQNLEVSITSVEDAACEVAASAYLHEQVCHLVGSHRQSHTWEGTG